MNIAGAILCGGKNVRMEGRNKAFLKVGGSPIVQTAIEISKGIFDEILLVTNSPEEYSSYETDCRIITDIMKDVGPLGGIHAALSQTTKEAVFFVGCDMPFLHRDTIIRQIEYFNTLNCDGLVPKIGDLTEPLHAVYRKTLKDDLSRFIKKSPDHSIRGFLSTVNVSYWEVDNTPSTRKIFKNINTPEDLKENG